jgi:hypothetical protein
MKTDYNSFYLFLILFILSSLLVIGIASIGYEILLRKIIKNHEQKKKTNN